MLRKAKRYALLLAAMLLAASSLPHAYAEASPGKVSYEVVYTTEDLSTPTAWYNSDFFDNPDFKENRFVQYWVETPIAPGGPRDTGLYAAYREDGLYIFFQSNEQELDTNGILKNSSIELFIKYGLGDLPYHQMIFETNGSAVNYYEWQTEYRDNLPLKGNAVLTNEQLPTGWGSVLFIPWKAAYKYVPLNGEDWEFAMIRWSPSHSPTWGGKVHQAGRFNTLDIEEPTPAVRTAIQKNVIRQAWQAFNDTVADLQTEWQGGDADDVNFYNTRLQPLIAQGQANGSEIPNLDSLGAAEIDELYDYVDSWFELNRDAEDERADYILDNLFNEGGGGQPPETALALQPEQPDGVNGWYVSEVTVNLSAAGGSGVFTEYRLNGGEWTTYSGPFAISSDGVHTLEYRSADGAGNTEEIQTASVSVDRTAPTAAVAYSTTDPTDGAVMATVTPSEAVTVTNNNGADSYEFLYNGNFTFEFVDAAGNTGTATATVGNIASASTGVPGKPSLSDNNGQNNGLMDGDYDIAMNVWWGNNGRIYKLYENGTLIDTQMLADRAPQAQAAQTAIAGRANGTYVYYAELINEFGTTVSDEWTVTVSHSLPAKPELSSNNWDGDGSYDIQMNMWWGTNGTTYRLYENETLIAEMALTAQTPQAQSAVVPISGRAVGTYEYRGELVNAAGAASSEKIIVKVTK
ncbi:OmpL47-type beta-barrel domain-containing protein [Cohnella sp.]|uniref:OmpL47-type beta-barrel domain-containing protein n=1 Tax=Cohnella sp. TaxID=1883426 RepID=UPI00370439E7